MNTRRLLKHPSVIAGGGAIEMELSAHLREHSRGIYGKQQLLIAAYAKSLEVIPRQVAANAGMDPTDVLNKLRMKHAHGAKWFGVDVIENGASPPASRSPPAPLVPLRLTWSRATQASATRWSRSSGRLL
jgi:T-complex protein 1 subunit eta